MDLQTLFDWLVDGAPGAPGPDLVVARLAVGLVESGVPVARIAAFVRTLHPHIMGRSFVWRRGTAAVQVSEAPYAMLQSEVYTKSPVGHVFASGAPLRRRLEGDAPLDFAECEALRREGVTDYLVLPLRFTDGQVHAIAYATDVPGGFTEAAIAALHRVTRPLCRLAEILALRRTATNLLSAYVGRDAGARILDGHVQRGDTERIRCVIWFSDLRGFTALSDRSAATDIIHVLNQVFDCQVPAIEAHGGQVLKFIGDGLLAIFPVDESRAAAQVCAQAAAASRDAFAALDVLNVARSGRDEPALGFGLSLHLGDVAYGNIGGAGRLDFTCIGAAVNVAARIEGLTARLGRRVLVSEEFAQASATTSHPLGSFELKGVARAQSVYGLEP